MVSSLVRGGGTKTKEGAMMRVRVRVSRKRGLHASAKELLGKVKVLGVGAELRALDDAL